MEKPVKKMNDVELWFEYRTLHEAGVWTHRHTIVENEIIARNLKEREKRHGK